MKSLQDYSREWRGGAACARQVHDFKDYDPQGDDPTHFLTLPEPERAALLNWIRQNIKPRKTICNQRNSYGLKHNYEADTGNYVTNGQFKGAMIMAGYAPHDATALNPSYAISKNIGKNR